MESSMPFSKGINKNGGGSFGQLAFITCYDYQTACWLKETEVDGILVGDSLSEVFYGYSDTTKVDVEIMLRHTEAVKKGLAGSNIHLIGDLPAGSYDDEVEAVKTAKQFFSIGVDSVKLENPKSEVVTALVNQHMSVLGHVGLTPQTNQDYKKQGNSEESAKAIKSDAMRLDGLGCYGVVLEAIPTSLAEDITRSIKGISIGIATGKAVCDAEIRVYTDVVGFTKAKKKFAKSYGDLGGELVRMVNEFIRNHR